MTSSKKQLATSFTLALLVACDESNREDPVVMPMRDLSQPPAWSQICGLATAPMRIRPQYWPHALRLQGTWCECAHRTGTIEIEGGWVYHGEMWHQIDPARPLVVVETDRSSVTYHTVDGFEFLTMSGSSDRSVIYYRSDSCPVSKADLAR